MTPDSVTPLGDLALLAVAAWAMCGAVFFPAIRRFVRAVREDRRK